MDNFSKALCILLFGFVMTFTIPTCIEWIQAFSDKNGDMGTASYYPIKENSFGYSLTYNLDGGTLSVDNPTEYGIYSPTFTLNNPTKTGFEFIGWTGSNGTTPQLTVTICTGSAGDLEFTANYEQILELFLDENGIVWTTIDGLTEFDVYVNETKCLTTSESRLSLENLNKFCNEGINTIYIKSGEACSNIVEYNYIDLSNFENLTFNFRFSRSSEGYSFGLGSMAIGYTYAGEQKGGFIDYNIYEEGLTYEEHFLKQLNSKRENSTLKVHCSLFEIAEYINSQYVDGDTDKTIDVSNKFYFVINDSFNTNYTPKNMSVCVTYGKMFNETPFYEGCTVKLNDCYSGNAFEIVQMENLNPYANNQYQYRHCASIYLESTPDCQRIDYEVNLTSGEKYFSILGVGYSALSEDEFNSYLKDCKFYLNSDYYFQIKGNFTVLYKSLFEQVTTQRNQYEESCGNSQSYKWANGTVNYTLNVSEYFNVYSSDGELADFEYTLEIDCKTYSPYV